MSFDAEEKQWKCVKGGTVNFQRVSSIVRDIGEPCLYQSPIKINKMLKPEKWQATFDSEGKILGFQKVLKLIILGGVDPSIRPEVWEFLLGCYSLSSTAEYRRQLRTARRERYRDLVKQCQRMHSSIGTGSLAYIVGSKVMDMRISSKEDRGRDTEVQSARFTDATSDNIEANFVMNRKSSDKSYTCQKEGSDDSGDLVCVRDSAMGGAYDSSCRIPSPDPCNYTFPTAHQTHEPNYMAGSYLDFPALPFRDLFEENNEDTKVDSLHEDKNSSKRKLRYDDEHMHSFEIDNNADLVVESDSLPTNSVSQYDNPKSDIINSDMRESISRTSNLEYGAELFNGLRISDAPELPAQYATTSQGGGASEDRVSEWLWTLHRIVVDVVRTDSHLEFYEDTKNLARMSDILAVYAWVDPATGYCQGMSDLLSPFIVLFEDNADAFWCFEMLLRRMRENFKMEGPTGVMKQLQALWHILELTDREMFSHLSHIGAQSLHFAFRMLLVLFRRELSFNEALCMWEMIWAADFNVTLTCLLDENCPEVLAIQLSKEAETESGEESTDCGGNPSKHGTVERSISDNGIESLAARPFCGLTKTFWSRSDHFQIRTLVSSTKNGDDELPVFCVAAVLIINRQKIIRETRSIDDLIKIFNDNILKIRVKRCVRTAIKLRKKYFYKVVRLFCCLVGFEAKALSLLSLPSLSLRHSTGNMVLCGDWLQIFGLFVFWLQSSEVEICG
ncbi:Ypt/Rab-GAP domain of gyp1p superfamily protein [Striga hermonthica]|uniref:Ypt/Rab-GAP domain of gyp1p superfamily protein n=1 Tax=Striga hermonthica TaxID=68872 RepID=A0A9N7NLR1_STRHE|nr:Ypt/Rab-GAP domain of gyp1p superfamily protein [Striga hermonthica]